MLPKEHIISEKLRKNRKFHKFGQINLNLESQIKILCLTNQM